MFSVLHIQNDHIDIQEFILNLYVTYYSLPNDDYIIAVLTLFASTY